MYTEKDLVCVAKRENNKKRNYLVVNRLQGKHVPVEPGRCLGMFDALAETVKAAYGKEKTLLVGFAETATAIGARLAVDMGCHYMQTTREKLDGVEYLYFTEAHSHAAEQKLVKTDLDRIVDGIDRIVFVEDEVTTGNTILGIVAVIRETYGKKIAFSVASILNGMDGDAQKRYAENGITLHYLVKTDHSGYPEVAAGYREDGIYHGCGEGDMPPVTVYRAEGYMDARRLVKGEAYGAACRALASQMERWFPAAAGKSALVVGTEEFMYPAIYAASRMERGGWLVKCHATTRSPIAVSKEAGYPLHERYELHSLYEDGRRTFIYDLGKYDKAVVLTDSASETGAGLWDLCRALEKCGNEDICVVRWC